MNAGAALYGAGITRGFRTKDIRVQDITPYGIDVSYEADKSSEGTLALFAAVAVFRAEPLSPSQTPSPASSTPTCSPFSPRLVSKRP